MSTPPSLPAGLARPLATTLLWLPVSLAVALATPWLGLAPESLQGAWDAVPLAVTFAVLLWNLVAAFRIVGATGQPHRAWPFTLALFALFTLLFFQVACHLGAEHYRWDREPQPWDWLLFSAVHALRAGDLFDGLEAYGIDLQVIAHDGPLVASLLLAFHLVLDLFLIAVLFQRLGSLAVRYRDSGAALLPRRWPLWLGLLGLGAVTVVIWHGISSNSSVEKSVMTLICLGLVLLFLNGIGRLFLYHLRPNGAIDGRRVFAWAVVVLLAVVAYSALVARPWRREDLYLWPLSNLAHVVDVGDALHLFDLEFTQVPRNLWEGSLTFACRVLLGLALGGLLAGLTRWLSLHFLGGYGLPRETLAEVEQRTQAPRLLALVRERLANLDAATVPPARFRPGWALLPVASVTGLCVAAFGFGWPAWDNAARHLAGPALAPADPAHGPALRALRRLGTPAGVVAPDLAAAVPGADADQRQKLLETLAYLGPQGLEELGEMLEWGPPEIALACVAPVARCGPAFAVVLARGMGSSFSQVSEAVQERLGRFGRAAVPALIAGLTRANAAQHAILFEKLDPVYWHRAAAPNPVYVELVARATSNTFLVGNPDATGAVRDLGWSRLPIPKITRRLRDPDAQIREDALRSLQRYEGDIGADGLVALLAGLDDPILQVRDLAQRLLDTATRLGTQVPGGQAALLPLTRLLVAGGSQQRLREVVRLLKRLDPHWPSTPDALPLLLDALKGPDTARQAAVTALRRVRPEDRAQVVPHVVELLSSANAGVLRAALQTLGEFGQAAAPALNQLERLLASDPETVRAVLQALQGIATRHPGIEARLRPLLAESVDDRAAAVAVALVKMDPSAAELAVARLDALLDRSGPALGSLAFALGQIGPPARPVVPRLLRRLADPNEAAQSQLVVALDRIDPNWRALPPVGELIPRWVEQRAEPAYERSGAALVALVAADAQWRSRPEVRAALPSLVRLVGDPDPERRSMAAWVLGEIGPQAAPAVPVLIERLGDANDRVRRVAAQSLGAIGPAARAALDSLRQRSQDRDVEVRNAACWAIQNIEGRRP